MIDLHKELCKLNVVDCDNVTKCCYIMLQAYIDERDTPIPRFINGGVKPEGWDENNTFRFFVSLNYLVMNLNMNMLVDDKVKVAKYIWSMMSDVKQRKVSEQSFINIVVGTYGN